jgi:hypothetical protein
MEVIMEPHADTFRLKAEECARNAEKARSLSDKTAWLELAADWAKLADTRDSRARGLSHERQQLK